MMSHGIREPIVCLALLMSLLQPVAGEPEENRTPQANGPVSQTPLYVIKPNDILEVVVWGEPQISRRVLVRPDGRISLPLVQDLTAAELTPTELKEELENRLKGYVDSPNVTIIVDAIQSYQIYVIGKVQKPGSYVVEKPITVLQALTLAGGFQDYADDSGVTVIRTYEKDTFVFQFNYRDVIKGKNTYQNILLASGDVVVVP